MLNILLGTYLILVILDSSTTYVAIKYLGFIETWQSQVLFDYYGLTLGIVISTAFCFSVGWLLWRIRRFRVATCVGLSALALTELAAVISNTAQIFASP